MFVYQTHLRNLLRPEHYPELRKKFKLPAGAKLPGEMSLPPGKD